MSKITKGTNKGTTGDPYKDLRDKIDNLLIKANNKTKKDLSMAMAGELKDFLEAKSIVILKKDDGTYYIKRKKEAT